MLTYDDKVIAFYHAIREWPQQVVDAGVRMRDGRSYRPVLRNVTVLRFEGDPYGTLAEAKRIINSPDFEGKPGVETIGWRAICGQAGWKLTWEGVAVNPKAPWADLFTGAERHRVKVCGRDTEQRERAKPAP